MRSHHIFWIVCSVLVLVNAAPKPSDENVSHGNKEDVEGAQKTTPIPSDLSVDLPENWDQAKDDSQSLFINKSDKNDLEPYPMALSDDSADSYDGQPIASSNDRPKLKPGTLEHVIMRAELYGEPPSMGRQPLRRKRAEGSFRTSFSNPNQRLNKRGIKYVTLRNKRDTGVSDELRTLLALWNAEQQQHRYKDDKDNYYDPYAYYNQYEPYEDTSDDSNPEENWMDEPLLNPNRFSGYYNTLYEKPRYKHPDSYSDYKIEEPDYIQHLETLRRKRQWAGFGNKNHYNKRFMVAKKRSEPNQYYYSQRAFKPREDLYSLNELLESTQNIKNQGIPISRRMIL